MRKDFTAAKPGAPVDEAAFVADYWTRVWQTEGDLSRAHRDLAGTDEFRVIDEHLRTLAPGAAIVDAGCGLGQWALFLRDRGMRVTAIDISKPTIDRLAALFPDAAFRHGDVRDTGLTDASQDAVISWGVFEHFEEGPLRCLAESFRILRPGGLLLISVPYDNWRQSFSAQRDTRVAAPPGPEGLRFYQWRFTRGELRTEIARAGFAVRDIVPIHRRQGALRFLQHSFGLDQQSRAARVLSAAIAAAAPAAAIAHMLLAVARKP
ncbi:MAG: methyltransferase domain-containing protein [Alphaproteobacteria bacterium]|nr:methyltransferase domain-containing protein [Alphaproteobacteria bacterium]